MLTTKMLGYLMEKEVQAVDNVLSNIKHPFTAIMGGSKVSTKIGIIENLMDKVDNLILCGGMILTRLPRQRVVTSAFLFVRMTSWIWL